MRKNLVALLQRYGKWVHWLSRESTFMFAAHSSWGRSAKVFLFAVGIVMPLGSLIWIALFFHGKIVRDQSQAHGAIELIADA